MFNLHHALYYALYAWSHLVGLPTIKSEGRNVRWLWRAGVGEGGARRRASVGERASRSDEGWGKHEGSCLSMYKSQVGVLLQAPQVVGESR